MIPEVYIDKDRTLTPAQDYEFLRAAGRDYIEQLGHALWTDYNAHDPGITILEVLCYAITELGYRANFDIKDLLAGKDGVIENKTFFTAKNILTNAPLTPLDYRKMFIDIEGVNNAWIVYGTYDQTKEGYLKPLPSEIPVYINTKEDKLSLDPLNKFGETNPRLPIRGLNKVVVSLSEDDELGDLNEVAFAKAWLTENRFVEVDITLEFDSWNAEKAAWLPWFNASEKFEFMEVKTEDDHLEITVKRTADNSQTLTLFITPKDKSELPLTESYFSTEAPVADVIDKLNQKRVKVHEVYAQIDTCLRENRNLTEDWRCTKTVGKLDIGICADIHLNVGVDAEETMAMVNQAIVQLLDPPIRFYTLHQMLEMGLTTTEIFHGPSLKHGFLLTSEVENAQLPICIHASEIIADLMNIPGVKSVDNLLLTAYDKMGKPIEGSKNEAWCLNLPGDKQPVFAARKSKLLVFREGIPLLLSEKGNFEFSQGISYLQAENNTYKLQDPIDDFPVPAGKQYALNSYYSIQNEFPQTYGIGAGHLSAKAPAQRKAQAKQLKAYLMHFDQLLADFFGQLQGAKDLLDSNPIDRSYFTQILTDIPGVDAEWFHEEGLSAGYQSLLKGNPSGTIRSIYEDENQFFERRNRALDHLLARFGTSFNDYVFMMHTMQQNARGIAEQTLQQEELIADKEQFLNKLPKLSYGRGLGIDYCQPKNEEFPWKLKNRGGYESRVAGLLGINRDMLEDILDEDPKSSWSYDTAYGKLNFKMMSVPTLSQAEQWELGQRLINNVGAYKVETYTNTFIYFVNVDDKKIAKLDHAFTDADTDNADDLNSIFDRGLSAEEKATVFIPKLYQAINSELENFYCLEHIHLRPLFTEGATDEDLLSVCLNDDCDKEVNRDPYSFKATIVAPGWLARFRNRYFRQYATRIFQEEAPAHTLIKVCWVGPQDMGIFQKAYKTWINAYCELKTEYCSAFISEEKKIAYNTALSDLVNAVKSLNSIYDVGTLYDCQESELDNPIILNNSSLGSLENIPS